MTIRQTGVRCVGSWIGRPHGKDCVVERRVRAEERQQLRAARSSSQQLRELDRRLGKGLGAKRERARLARAVAREDLAAVRRGG